MLRPIKVLFKVIITLLLLIGIALSIVLSFPKLLSPLIVDYFEQKGVVIQIDKLSASWNKGYQLDAELDAKSVFLPISVKQAKLSVVLNITELFNDLSQSTPFKSFSLHQANVFLPYQRDEIIKTIEKTKSLLPRNAGGNNNLSPQIWKINANIFPNSGYQNAESAEIIIHANGVKSQLDKLSISHKDSGKVDVLYEPKNNTYDIISKQINLSFFLGKNIQLNRLRATVFAKNMLYSTGFAETVYEGVKGEISLIGRGEKLNIDIRSAGKRLGLSVSQFGKNNYQLDFNQFDLAFLDILKPVLNAALRQLNSENLIQPINDLSLSGVVSGSLRLNENHQIELAHLKVKNISVDYANYSIKNVSGRIDWDEGLFYYVMNFNQSILNLPSVFKIPIRVDSGMIEGDINLPDKQLNLTRIFIKNKDIESLSSQGIIWRWDDQFIEVQAQGENIDITKLNKYLSMVLSSRVQSYLSSALLKGKTNHTQLNIKGYYPNLTSRKNNEFLLTVNYQNTDYKPYKNVPRVFVKKGVVTLDKKYLSIAIDQGNLGLYANRKQGIPAKAIAVIQDLKKPLLSLQVTLDKTSYQNILKQTKNSLISPYTNKVSSFINVGSAKLGADVALNINLKKDKKPDIDVDLKITQGKKLSLKSQPQLLFERFDANVLVNEKGVVSLNLNGQFDGYPAKIDLSKIGSQYRLKTDISANIIDVLIDIDLLTSAQAKLIRSQKLILGRSKIDILGDLSSNMVLKKLQIKSNLKGVSLNLWESLKKTPQTSLPLTFEYTNHSVEQINLKIGSSNSLLLELGKKDQKIRKVHVGIGQSITKKQIDSPFHLTLIAPKVNFNEMTRFFKEWSRLSDSNTQWKDKTATVYIDIAKATVGEPSEMIPNNQFKLLIKGSPKTFYVQSPLISGAMSYYPNHFGADLNYIDPYQLYYLFTKEELNVAGRKVNRLSLAKQLPVMNIKSNAVIWKNKVIGKLDLVTSLNNDLYALDHLFLEGDHFFIQATGKEAIEKKGVTTRLAVDIKSENIRDIVKSFQLNDVMDGKYMDFSMNLSWLGKAHLLNIDKSKGEAFLKAQDLKFINIGTGAGSVLGLIDLVGTLNRIFLDFENITTSKLAFDTVDGHWTIDNGIAFANSVRAEGSLIDLEIKGTTNLASRKFNNLRFDITPKASNIIPIVGAVGAGPIGAAVGFIVQKVAGDTFDKVAKYTYYLQGDWTNPELIKF